MPADFISLVHVQRIGVRPGSHKILVVGLLGISDNKTSGQSFRRIIGEVRAIKFHLSILRGC